MIEFDGVPIRTEDEFLMRVRRALPYSTVKVVVMRGEGDVKEKVEIPSRWVSSKHWPQSFAQI